MSQRLILFLALSAVITLLIIAPNQKPKLTRAVTAPADPIGSARQRVEDQPRSPEFRLKLANLLIDADQLDEARGQLDRALELDDRLPTAHVLLARIDHRQGQWESAADHLAKASSLQPESRELGMLAASALIEVKRDTAARTILLRLIRDGSEDAAPLVMLAELYARREQWSLAITAMEQAVELTPPDLRGPMLRQLGEWSSMRFGTEQTTPGH